MLPDHVPGRGRAAWGPSTSGDYTDGRRNGRFAAGLGYQRPASSSRGLLRRRGKARRRGLRLLRLSRQYRAHRAGVARRAISNPGAPYRRGRGRRGAATRFPKSRDPRHQVYDGRAGLSRRTGSARDRLPGSGRGGSQDGRRHHLRRVVPWRVHRRIARRLCAHHREAQSRWLRLRGARLHRNPAVDHGGRVTLADPRFHALVGKSSRRSGARRKGNAGMARRAGRRGSGRFLRLQHPHMVG